MLLKSRYMTVLGWVRGVGVGRIIKTRFTDSYLSTVLVCYELKIALIDSEFLRIFAYCEGKLVFVGGRGIVTDDPYYFGTGQPF